MKKIGSVILVLSFCFVANAQLTEKSSLDQYYGILFQKMKEKGIVEPSLERANDGKYWGFILDVEKGEMLFLKKHTQFGRQEYSFSRDNPWGINRLVAYTDSYQKELINDLLTRLEKVEKVEKIKGTPADSKYFFILG